MALEKTFASKDIEKKFYDLWQELGCFAAHPDSNQQPYTIMMPPPNVTGSLHMGHALTMTLQDVLTRYHRMKGRDALWQPGTDHAGIATQMVVERQLDEKGESRHNLGREKFIDKVWEWKEQSGGTIVEQLKRLGASPDWPRERFTMDEGLSKAVLKVFVQLYKEGLIYRDKRLVNWDPKLQTAVSDIEVEHKEVKGKLYHVQYPLEEGGFISIATTRPETILADGAIAVHPDDEKYKDLVGKCAVVPVCNRIIPIITDEYVKSEFGSGAVKITAAHDYNDFEVYMRHKDTTEIPLINLMNPDGTMNENCPEDYVGMDRFEARKKIIADLEDLEYLEKVENHVHQVPYGDRSGVVIEPYLTDQWYCDAKTLAQPAIEAVKTGKTKFVPQNWENTYFQWMENIQPWCISRQLWWGHQIPAWYGPDGHVFVAESEDEAYKQSDAYYTESVTLKRDTDVLDTWFSSALWPFSTLGWPEDTKELQRYYPGDVLVTGFDIIFFWVARMMMFGIHFMDDVPFHTVYMHALVRDAKGQKMSKSKGNVMDPLDLIDQYGADALRFTLVAMAAQGRDIKLSEQRVEGYRNFATKLWNAARYAEMNGCALNENYDPEAAEFTANKWIISEVAETKAAIDKAMEEYRFNDAAAAIYHFTWHTFCDWYLEFTKAELQKSESQNLRISESQNGHSERSDSEAEESEVSEKDPSTGARDDAVREEIQSTTAWVLDQILIMLNPFMPFLTEELYEQIAERRSEDLLITHEWPKYEGLAADTEAQQKMDWLIRIISEIRSVRADMNVPAGARIQLLVKDACAATKEGLDAFEEIIKRMARIENIGFTDNVPKGSIQTVLDQTTLILPIADIIDLDAEKARLKKEIDKLEEEIKKIEAKLGNEKFVANAPEEVVAEQHERKSSAAAAREKFSQALEQLEAA